MSNNINCRPLNKCFVFLPDNSAIALDSSFVVNNLPLTAKVFKKFTKPVHYVSTINIGEVLHINKDYKTMPKFPTYWNCHTVVFRWVVLTKVINIKTCSFSIYGDIKKHVLFLCMYYFLNHWCHNPELKIFKSSDTLVIFQQPSACLVPAHIKHTA